MRRLLAGLAFGLAASCAVAQTAPSPADVGISKGTPDVFKLKGHDNVWTPFGSVDPSTHVFAPGTNGSIAPNDCLKWGPGITSAGMACGSGGGGGGGGPFTIYTSHSGLVNNVTTPTEAWTVQQQGFYQPGDGGEATYNWNFGSYCPNGTSVAPTAADGLYCVLPVGQSASTAGRYLLNLTNGAFNVRQFGMQPSVTGLEFDNSPYVRPIIEMLGAAGIYATGPDVIFPLTLGQNYTTYYFSQPFELSRAANLSCATGGIGTTASGTRVQLVFAAGIDGVRQENGRWSSDGAGADGSGISGCTITSLGRFATGADVGAVDGASVLTTVAPSPSQAMQSNPSIPPIGVGDGLLIMSSNWTVHGAPAVQPGAYASAVSGDLYHQMINLAQTSDGAPRNYVLKQSPSYYGGMVAGAYIWDLPASEAYTVQTTAGSEIAVVTGGRRPLKPGALIWSDPFLFGTMIGGNNSPPSVNNQVASATVNSGGSGYVGASGTMTWSGIGCTPYGINPVLNVTASGGVITSVTSVATPGTCDGAWIPPNGTDWVAGGGLSGGGGATFNMTYANTVQMTTIANWPHFSPAAATGTYKLWALPAGVMRRASGGSRGSRFEDFPVGLEELVSGATSLDQSSSYGKSVIGRFITGADASPSTDIGGEYDFNSATDILEAESLFGIYININVNSPEEGVDNYPVMAYCGTLNYTTFIGGYVANNAYTDGSCLGGDANGNPNIGVPLEDINILASQGSLLTLGSAALAGQAGVGVGQMTGRWSFSGAQTQYIITSHATSSGARVLVDNVPSNFFAGMGVTDQTNPNAIPANTVLTELDQTGITISNPVVSPGVQVDDKLVFSITNNATGGCVQIKGGIELSFMLMADCQNSGLSMVLNGYIGAWQISSGGGTILFPDNAYVGYQSGAGIIIPSGISIGSASDGTYSIGEERMIEIDPAPFTDDHHRQGDIRFNRLPVPGGHMQWAYSSFTGVTLTADLNVGDASASVASCPSGVSVGTPINTNYPPEPHIGDFASCSGTTLTFQAPALAFAGFNYNLTFMTSFPAAPIANDAAGTQWTLGNYLTLTPVALASLPATCAPGTFAVVSNGVASPVYNAAVGSTTGAATDPVFCTDGNVWKYH